jgi:hypothetical protein
MKITFTFLLIIFFQPVFAQQKELSTVLYNVQKGMTRLLLETSKLKDSSLVDEVIAVQSKMNACFNSIMNHSEALDSLYIPEFQNYNELINNSLKTNNIVYISEKLTTQFRGKLTT